MHKDNSQYISLKQASNFSDYSQDYLSLRARQGKLKAVKLGRNWVTKKEWLEEYTNNAEEYKEEHNDNNDKKNINRYNGNRISDTQKNNRDFTYKRPVLSHAIIAVAILVFILFSGGVAFGYYSNSILKPLSSVVGSVITSIDLGVNETVKDISESKVFEYTSKSIKYAFEYVDEYIEYLLKTESSQYVIKNIKDVSEKIIIGKDIIFNEISETKFARYVKGVFEYVNEEAIVFINIISKKVWDNNLFANIEIPDYIKSSISDNIRNFKKFTGEITSKLFSPIKRGYEFVIRPWKIIPSSQFEISRQEFEERDREEINNIKTELERLKEEGIVAKEIIKEVSKITQVEPIKEITKEIIKIDDQELAKLKSQIAGIQKWEGDIRNLQILTSKLQTNPPYTQITTAPVYIASQGLQVDGVGIFSSLGVSGSAGITNLGVGDSTSLGSDSSDRLTVNATSEFLSPVAIENTFTVGDTTNYLTIDSTGNLTTTGNLTVQGTQTGTGIVSYTASSTNPVLVVNQTGSGPIVRFQDSGNTVFQIAEKGALTLTSTSTPQFKIAYDNSNYLTGSVSSAGDSTIASTGGLNLTGNATSTWQVVESKLTIQTATSGDIYLTSAGNLTQKFATTSAFTLYHGETARLAVDSSGNISATGTTIALVGGTTITGSATTTGDMVVQATTTLATTTITRLGIGTTEPSQLFHTAGTGNILFENTGTVSITPTATTSFGASTSTPIIFTGYISSNIYPYTDNNYDLGSSSYRWQDIYAVSGHFGGTIDITTDKIDATSALTIESGDTLTVTSTNAFALGVAGTERFNIDTSGNIVLTGGITFSGSATTTGNLVVQATTTLATTTITRLGVGAASLTEALTVSGNILVSGSILPQAAGEQYIGEAGTDWGYGYFKELHATNLYISATTSLGGVTGETFTINTDATTTESSYLRFYRGGGIPAHAILAWDANNDRFDINFPLYISSTSTPSIFSIGTLYLEAGEDLIQKFATTSAFTLYHGETARLAIDSSGNIYATGTTISLVGDTTITGRLGVTATSTLATTTISNALTIGSSLALSDSSGTLTLSNIDSIDATTESTIESAIDTLSNLLSASSLASIGTIATGTWQGTIVGTQWGGTGQNWGAITTGSIPYFSSLGTMGIRTIGGANTVLYSDGTVPQWGTVGASSVTANSLDWAQFTNTMTLDATTTITMGYPIDFDSGTLYIDPSGYIGIGTTTPSTALYVIGTATIGTITGATIDTANNTITINEADINDGTVYPRIAASENITGGWTFSTATTTFSKDIQLGSVPIYFANGTTYYIDANAQAKLATTTLTGQLNMSDQLIINIGNAGTDFTSGGGLTLAGVLSVTGTSTLATTTATKLTVSGASTLTGNTAIAGTLDVTGNFNINTNKFQVTAASGDTAIAGTLDVTGTSTLATTTVAGDLIVNTNQLYIQKSSGNVGIGNTGPTEKLTVRSSTASTTLISNVANFEHIFSDAVGLANIGSGLLFSAEADDSSVVNLSQIASVFGNASSTIPQTDLRFYTRDSGALAERVRITKEGNVGIGTTTPSTKLDIWGNLQVGTSSTPVLYVDTATGYVGIGTRSAASSLDVYDTSDAQLTLTQTDASNYAQFKVDANGNLTITPSGGDITLPNGDIYICSGSACGITSVDGTGNVVIENNLFVESGNVGIGTTDPKTKLDVDGAIKIGTQDTCDADSAGAVRYDSSVKKFYGCDGTSWLSLEQQSCGYTVTWTYKGSSVTYGTVYNATTGRCWLDRNLGALQVANAYNDSDAYGDLFQWGRLDDGHQTRTSGTTATLSTTDVPGHSNFILAPDAPNDWRSGQNDNLWQGVDGINNPCPSGWRIPTETEWEAERTSWTGGNNYTGAYASPLKLTAGGYRGYSNASLVNVDSVGYYWSSAVSDANARSLHFYGSAAYMNSDLRAYGFSVRCVQD